MRGFRSPRRRPGLQDRQDLLGKQSQTAFGDLVGHATKPKRDVQLEVPHGLTPRFKLAQDALRGALDGGLHEAVGGAVESALFGDCRLLGVGVVTLHLGKMIPEEFI